MACYSPLRGFRGPINPASGKRPIVFKRRDADPAREIFEVTLPCGQCIGCRLEKSRQWAIRCVHEASLYERNAFITLTYDEYNLPDDGSLRLEDFQKFMKRLRKRCGEGIRFFHCGEYGEKFKRPHYHACLFNFDFDDKELFSTRHGVKLYISRTLSELWPFGFSTVGDVTFESAAYVARYITKKVTGDAAERHYERVDEKTGEVWSVKPEYTTMSRRPGIGKPWLEKFAKDVYPDDFVVLRGKKMKPPKYYDLSFEIDEPELFRKIKASRRAKIEDHMENNTYERLRVREEIQLRKFEKLKRGYENGEK